LHDAWLADVVLVDDEVHAVGHFGLCAHHFVDVCLQVSAHRVLGHHVDNHGAHGLARLCVVVMMAAAGESQCRYIYNRVYMQAFHAAKVRISEQSAKEKEKFRAIKRVLVAFL
jgi:hypothetical protein